MFPILADAEAEPSIIIGLTAITMLVAMFSLLFFVRRLQHKEIMAAIEKASRCRQSRQPPKVLVG
jgi:hypothetical protein